ncbi:MAG: L-glyceraldehyde 3-phosphate reductase [Bacteroidales bacterium]|nr:L-glyceraldehyde 3-phosphate reductase [Bacteroidales bacterium]
MNYTAKENRYDSMIYNRCGKSGLKLPAISLGLWHNFGHVDSFENAKNLVFKAFDSGITHFDLANNYGPPPGSAEENFGKILHTHLKNYRDEIIISTKAGYWMWPGPYGEWGSKKYLTASLDQSLKRMKLDYVDIFYHHRPDPDTPMEESLGAVSLAIKQGKALYAGISNYSANDTLKAINILKELGTPLLIHQPKYSMLVRWIEEGLSDVLIENGVGSIAFSPLAQGLLTNRYLKDIPEDSRAAKQHGFLKTEEITPEVLNKINKLNQIAVARDQSLAQMALAWVLHNPAVTSVLIGASKVLQLMDNINMLSNINFTKDELKMINTILKT